MSREQRIVVEAGVDVGRIPAPDGRVRPPVPRPDRPRPAAGGSVAAERPAVSPSRLLDVAAIALAVAGLVLVAAGVALWDRRAALVVAGVECIAAAYVAAYLMAASGRR